ncbi:MAG TPA: hypothetical protein DEG13_13695 [Candidatus Microthrix parvicella]|nr:hypothetical protein [Candidatus Microthrix parvicella]
MEAVRHLNHGGEMVGQPVGFETARTGKDGQALSLVGPELLNGRIVALVITLGEVHQVGLNVGHRIGIGAGGFELLDRLTGEVTQHQAVLMGFLGHPVGRQVDRDAMIGGRRQQPLEFGPGRNVGMQRHAGAIPLSDWGMGSQQPTGFVTGAQLRRPAARSESAASGGADAHVERSVPNQLTYSQT